MTGFLKGFIAAVGIGAAEILVINLLKESEKESNNDEGIKDEEDNDSNDSSDSNSGSDSTPVIKKVKNKVTKVFNKAKDSFIKTKDKIKDKIKENAIINNIKENKNIFIAILAIIAIIISYAIGKVHSKPRAVLYCLKGGLL